MKNILKKTRLIFLLIFIAGILPGCEKDDETTLPEIGERSRSSARLVAFDSCDALESALKEHLKEQMRVQMLTSDGIIWLEDAETDAPAGADDGGSGFQEGTDYSGTNNQESGVDESDFVKTDGYAVYLLSGREFLILEVPQFGRLEEGASLSIEGYPLQMLIYKDDAAGTRATRAVVFSSVSPWDIAEGHPLYEQVGGANNGDRYYHSYSLTKITIIDLTDPASPLVTRELYCDGSFQTGRRIDGSVRFVGYSRLEVYGLTYWPELPDEYYNLPADDPRREQMWNEAVAKAVKENDALIDRLSLEDLVPLLYELGADGSVKKYDFAAQGCSNFALAEDGTSRGFTSILGFDLLAAEISVDAQHIVSNWSTVYSSTDTMIIAEPAQDWWWYYGTDDEFEEATNIHRFDISAAGKAEYTGSGRVSGTINDQFSLSEHDDYIRVAATTGQWNRWWLEAPEAPANYVYVLAGDNESLEVVGQVGPIAQGERIWAARFIGDQGFLVTFRNVDPLWTLDLSDPENPAVKGELEVPGVSTYIHPIDENHLLTIGFGGDETGLDWSEQVSLFDVSDFDNAVLVDSLPLTPPAGDGWSAWGSSEATWEHKAFQYWAPRKLLAVPVSAYRTLTGPGYYHYEYSSRLELISVDTREGLSAYGSVDQSDFYNLDNDTYWCGLDIRRSIFVGDYIYAVGDRVLTAGSLDNMTTTAAVTLPGSDCYYYYDDVVVEGRE